MAVQSSSGSRTWLSPDIWTSKAYPWLIVATIGAFVFFWDGLISLGAGWSRPEYSYGPLVPLITGYLTLREIHRDPVKPDYGSRLPGLALLVLALAVGLLGNLAKIPDVITYGFIIYVAALILVWAGTREGFRFWPGWLHLIFMLPLPQFIYLHVSTELQSISSIIGVGFIQLANVPVYLDGNVIDLGIYKLQVAEACSGLRYLFPLFSFGWLIAVLYKGPAWHRVVIFLSTIPVTILMNSFRIGVIGVLVDSYGISQAEGFLHFFEGWIIFIACTLILYIEAWFLQKFLSFGYPKAPHVLNVDFDGVLQPLRKLPSAAGNAALMTTAVAVLVAGIAWHLQPEREAQPVNRLPLGIFPMQIGDWEGQSTFLDREVERVLGADDYLVANYTSSGRLVNLLVTFYNSQTEGAGIHSPEVCIPGGGWEVSQWEQVRVVVQNGGQSQVIPVNQAIIQRGLERQLVYYWFEQRGLRTTNDYEVKLMSMIDTITKGRSDGGLVRLITPLGSNESVESGALRLNGFLEEMMPIMPRYIPEA